MLSAETPQHSDISSESLRLPQRVGLNFQRDLLLVLQ